MLQFSHVLMSLECELPRASYEISSNILFDKLHIYLDSCKNHWAFSMFSVTAFLEKHSKKMCFVLCGCGVCVAFTNLLVMLS